MKFKQKVKVPAADGAPERELEIELDTDTLLGGVLTKDEVKAGYMSKDSFEPEMDRRVKAATKGMVKLEDVAKDADQKKKVFEILGVEVGSDGKPRVTVDQLKTLQDEWRTKELQPAIEARDKATTRVSSLLRSQLVNEILMAANDARVHDHLRKAIRAGADAPIVSMLEPLFGYNEEHDRFFVKNGKDGFELSTDSKTSGLPYRTPSEYIADWGTKKENEPYIDTKRPGGAGLKTPSGTGGRTVLDLPSDGKPMTLQQYQAAQQAAGEGGRVEVRDPNAPPGMM